MNAKLENERLVLETTDKAGEMLSIYDKQNGREILYQADQGWSGRNPSLFPMVGSCWNGGKYEIDGKEYQMKNHGLVRYAVLEQEATPDSITYHMSSDEETRKQYPFDFDFTMKYSLEGNTVHVDYEIKNTGDTVMPFSFGLHPAFKTAWNEGEAFEDFSIEMEPKEKAEQIVFFPDMAPVERREVLLDEWNLSRKDLETFATLVYDDIKATSATLKYKGEPRVTMHFENYPYLALWSHPTASDFVCIEPWFGHSDFEKVTVPFDQREGTQSLEPGKTFTASYSIEVL